MEIKMQKENLKTLLAGLAFVLAFSFCSCTESTYTRKAVVRNITKDTITVEDEGGNFWEFFGDGFNVDDKVKLIMDNNHTDSIITDDIVKNVKRIK